MLSQLVSVRSIDLHSLFTIGDPLHLQGELAQPGVALDLHVRHWRRFLELPIGYMLEVTPDTSRGRFRVGIWLTPEMTGPQAARLMALHAQYHVGALGFHEEQVRQATRLRVARGVSCEAAPHPYCPPPTDPEPDLGLR